MTSEFRVVVDKDVPVPMRDGTVLRADVYRPADDGEHPVLLGRTPYGKDTWGRWIDPVRTAGEGFVVVINDLRGAFASDGEFLPFFSDITDGYDTVEWCAAQPWSNGRVGMFGSSAPGFVQLLAAVAQPPHLVAIAPMQTWWSFGQGCAYDISGAFCLYTSEWALIQSLADPARRLGADRPGYAERVETVAAALADRASWQANLPVGPLPGLPEDLGDWYLRWLAHPPGDELWTPLDISRRYQDITVPALHLVGWFDRFCRPTIDNYRGLRDGAGSALAREHQKLVIGPWPHGLPVQPDVGDARYGAKGTVDARRLVLDWYDHWLRDGDDRVVREPRVRYFVQGVDEWREADDWPVHPTATAVHLRSRGRANSAAGDGWLAADAPPGDEPSDAFRHDPADPVPSVPGRPDRPRGPVDERSTQDRADVLVYRTAPLETPLELVGPVTARLWGTTTARDADWVVKLVDIHPDGYVRRITWGMVRARHRDGWDAPAPVEPGTAVCYDVTLLPTAYVVGVGHRLAVEVAGSSFPEFDRNLGTGNPTGADGPDAVAPFVQLVHHDAGRPSHVLLPGRLG